MNEKRTSTILQRLPLVLAVTAASYGLPVQAQSLRGNTSMNSTSTSHGAPTSLQPRARQR
jgi:hypothetical protein